MVVASLSGEGIGGALWIVICDVHPQAEVLDGICEDCWKEGRRGTFTGLDFTLEGARKVLRHANRNL